MGVEMFRICTLGVENDNSDIAGSIRGLANFYLIINNELRGPEGRRVRPDDQSRSVYIPVWDGERGFRADWQFNDLCPLQEETRGEERR